MHSFWNGSTPKLPRRVWPRHPAENPDGRYETFHDSTVADDCDLDYPTTVKLIAVDACAAARDPLL